MTILHKLTPDFLEHCADGMTIALSGASRQLPQRGSHWRAGQAHTGRGTFYLWETVVPCCLDSQQLDKDIVPKLLPSVARHYLLRDIELPAVSSELTGLPRALPLGELARSA